MSSVEELDPVVSQTSCSSSGCYGEKTHMVGNGKASLFPTEEWLHSGEDGQDHNGHQTGVSFFKAQSQLDLNSPR